MKITIEIPIRLVSESNVREHWSKSHKRHKAQKIAVAWKMKEYMQDIKLPCKITLRRASPRQFDVDDNLRTAFKYIKDEVANQLIPGKRPGMADSDPRIEWQYDQVKSKAYYVILEIESS